MMDTTANMTPSARLLARGLGSQPERIAVVTRDRRVSYADLAGEIDAACRRLRSGGAGAGERMVIRSSDGFTMLRGLLAGLDVGLTVTVLSSGLGPSGRDARMAEFLPDLAFDDDGVHRLGANREPPAARRGGRVVSWTSGSTGGPAGIVFEAEALQWNALANAAALDVSADDRALVMLDPAYCYALVHQVWTHLAVGGSVVFAPRATWRDGACRAGVTTAAVVPGLLGMLCTNGAAASLRGIRQLTVGGAPVLPRLLGATAELLPGTELVVTYGLTEAGPRVASLRDAQQHYEQGVVGRPLSGVEAWLDDGELVVRSPSNRCAVLVSGRIEAAPPEVRTGDTFDWTESGALRWRGRRRALINRGGFKLLPQEIEQALLGDERVAAARVVGVPHERHGETPRAFVVPRNGEYPSAADLARRCVESLGSSWAPTEITLLAQLPAAIPPRDAG